MLSWSVLCRLAPNAAHQFVFQPDLQQQQQQVQLQLLWQQQQLQMLPGAPQTLAGQPAEPPRTLGHQAPPLILPHVPATLPPPPQALPGQPAEPPQTCR